MTTVNLRLLWAQYSAAQAACRVHAAVCHRCPTPIIDDEGNPGLLGEACGEGGRILRVYIDLDSRVLSLDTAELHSLLRDPEGYDD